MTRPSPAPTRTRRATVALALCGVGTAGVLGLVAGFAPTARAGSAAPAAAAQPGGLDPSHQQHASSMMPADSPDGTRALQARARSPHPALAPSALQADSTADLRGVDIASYQHPGGAAISWSAVRASGVSFAFVKATESTGYRNPYYAGDVRGAQAAGLTVGAYHFAQPAYSSIAQADSFAATVRTATPALPPVLDLEQTGGLGVAALQAWTASFLSRVHSDLGVTPMIYTGPYFWQTAMGGSTAFASYPLWVAHYTTAAAPASLGGWSRWTFWQWTDGAYLSPGTVPGIAATTDRDRFAGSAAQLSALAVGLVGVWFGQVAPKILGTTLSSAAQEADSTAIAGGRTNESALAVGWGRSYGGYAVSTDLAYWTVLGYGSDGPARARYATYRLQGHSYEQVEALLVAPMAASSNAAWVQQAYLRLLGRPVDASGFTAYTSALDHGLPRLVAALALAGSREGEGRVVDLLYRRWLGRPADPGAIANLVPRMTSHALTYETLQGIIVSCPEYVAHIGQG